MKNILITAGLSIAATSAPILFTLFATRKKTKELGRKVSKIGNTKIGNKLMHMIEMSGVDFLSGMIEDDGKVIIVAKKKD